MLKYRYKRCQTNHTTFVKISSHKVTVRIVHVDDIVVVGNNDKEIKCLKKHFRNEFEIKDLEVLKYVRH